MVGVAQYGLCLAGGATLALKLVRQGVRDEVVLQAIMLLNNLLKFGNL